MTKEDIISIEILRLESEVEIKEKLIENTSPDFMLNYVWTIEIPFIKERIFNLNIEKDKV